MERKRRKAQGLGEVIASLGTPNLRILANFTQHLYLDLEMLPYGPTDGSTEKNYDSTNENQLRETEV